VPTGIEETNLGHNCCQRFRPGGSRGDRCHSQWTVKSSNSEPIAKPTAQRFLEDPSRTASHQRKRRPILGRPHNYVLVVFDLRSHRREDWRLFWSNRGQPPRSGHHRPIPPDAQSRVGRDNMTIKRGATPQAREAGWRACAALAEARAAALAPIISEIRARGITSPYLIAAALTARRIPTARGHRLWASGTVSGILKRLDRPAASGSSGSGEACINT
jgi:hypothetical protein